MSVSRQSDRAGGSSGPFAFLSRRRFLKAGLWAGGAVLGAAGGAALWLRGTAPSVSGLAHLDDHEHQTLDRLVRVMFPPGGPMGLDVRAFDLPRAFDAFLAGEPDRNVSDLRSALVLLEYGPLLYDGRITTFSRLSDEEALAHWERWGASEELLRRQVALAFRKVLTMFFYDREEVWPHIGYPGPSFRTLGGGG